MPGARSSAAKPTLAPSSTLIYDSHWSVQQTDIFDWFQFGEGNLVVRARAGTGKTTTILKGVRYAPESNILLAAFNKRIAEELNGRLDGQPNAVAKTLHSVGFAAVRQHWPRVGVASGTARADQLTDLVVPKDTPKPIRRLVGQLHTKLRDTSFELRTLDDIRYAMLFYGLEPDRTWGNYDGEFVVQAARQAMQWAIANDPDPKVGIDFADMCFLALTHDLLSPTYDLSVIDEAQDMSAAQLKLVERVSTGRICVVGDDRQAIYGWRGADTGSIDRLKRELQAQELPLTVTYRCGQHIVEYAQKLVPDIQAAPQNPPGDIQEIQTDKLVDAAESGDFVLSRLNAPLVAQTLHFIRAGKRARMAGRDIGQGILAILRRLGVGANQHVDDVLTKLWQWETKQTTKYAQVGALELIERVQDQVATIIAISDGCDSYSDIEARCNQLFTDEVEDEDLILCSSVHKAKGLEARRVFVMMDTFYRRGVTQEEQNVEYVAVTRAIERLTFVRG